MSNHNDLEVRYSSGERTQSDTLALDPTTSGNIFERTGEVEQITIHLDNSILK
jgi:hypothetical protein